MLILCFWKVSSFRRPCKSRLFTCSLIPTVIKILQANSFDPNMRVNYSEGWCGGRQNVEASPLMLAIRYGCPQCVDLLLRLGADPTFATAEGVTTFSVAVRTAMDTTDSRLMRLMRLGGQIDPTVAEAILKRIISALEDREGKEGLFH